MKNYIQRTLKSRDLYERAKKVMPAGVSYGVRYFEPYPFYVTHGKGCKVYDVSGNEYTDYWIGHGALILGHCHPAVMQAVKNQLELGTHFGFCHEWEVRMAEQITKMVPSAELIRFTNSGTEANMYAIRLARSFTKRIKIGKFEGHWHGGYDALHVAVNWPPEVPESAGLPESATKNTVLLPFNDLEGVRKVLKKSELACVILEPVMGHGGFIPADREFLKGLREICNERGTLMIFDEVITGFRLAPGGAQEYYGVLPDITVLGKILFGGFPGAGAFCGRADIMELIDHLKHPNSAERSHHGGTFSANPLNTCAGYTTLKELEKGYIYRRINELGEKAREGLRNIIQSSNISAHVAGEGSLFCLHFTKEKPTNYRTANRTKDFEMVKKLHTHLLLHGIIFMPPNNPLMMLSSEHSNNNIETLLSLTEGFLESK